MFKKVLQSLSKSLHRSAPVSPAAVPPPAKAAPIPAPAATADAPAPGASRNIPAPQPLDTRSPEELCEISPKMNKEQIRERLKLLYRRFNQAASSLNTKTRAEAEQMLDAIVTVREKHFGAV